MNRGRWGVVIAMVMVAACSGSDDESAEPLVAEAVTTTASVEAEGAVSTEAAADDAAVSTTPADDGPSDVDDDGATVDDEGGIDRPDPAAESDTDETDETDETDDAEETSDVDETDEPESSEDAAPDPDDDGQDAQSTADDSGDRAGTAPASSDNGGTSGGRSGSGSATTALAAAGTGVTVSGPDLVPDDDIEPSCGASADNPCLPATNGHQPYEAVSMGEYQTNVAVPDGAILDVYFDQSRSLVEMERLCREMGGVFHTRPYDGSRWGGWGYCAHVDYP